MTVQTQKAAVYLLMEIVNGGDLRAAADVCAEGVIWHAADGHDARGLAAVRRMFGPVLSAFPDLTIAVQDLVGEGDRIACRFAWGGVQLGSFRGIAPTGRAVAVSGLGVFRFAAGRIVEVWWQDDPSGLLRQLESGALPPSILAVTVLRSRPSAAA